MIIYKTTNLINGKIYIGQHSKGNPRYIGSGGTVFKAALKEFGKKNFVREILEDNLTLKELDAREKYWIKVYDANNPEIGYNKTSGGGGGYEVTEDTKKKLSDANKGHITTEETKRKISEASKGKIISDEAKRKISESRKGHIVTEETRTKISKANKGNRCSEETRAKISDTKQKNPTIYTEEMRKNISAAATGKKASPETIAKIKSSLNGHKGYYEIWVDKYGKDEADIRLQIMQTKRKETNNKRREVSLA